MKQPNYLYNYTNLGYQSYLIAQEELYLIEKLHFESVRLGELLDKVSIAALDNFRFWDLKIVRSSLIISEVRKDHLFPVLIKFIPLFL